MLALFNIIGITAIVVFIVVCILMVIIGLRWMRHEDEEFEAFLKGWKNG